MINLLIVDLKKRVVNSSLIASHLRFQTSSAPNFHTFKLPNFHTSTLFHPSTLPHRLTFASHAEWAGEQGKVKNMKYVHVMLYMENKRRDKGRSSFLNRSPSRLAPLHGKHSSLLHAQFFSPPKTSS